MSMLSYYIQAAANDVNRQQTLRRQAEEAQTGTISCGSCGWGRHLTMAYRCLYCGIYFCFPCAEKHFGQTVKEWRDAKDAKV